MPLNTTAEQRIARATSVDGNGCWVWQRGRDGNGYGRIRFQGVAYPTHRFSYEVHRGPIPDGLVLDHLCRNILCCNPDHLEPVTQEENLKRGQAPNMVTHREGVCRRGHELTGHNVIHRGDGRIRCRECHNSGIRERRLMKRQSRIRPE
jgi:hypothetical protein